MDVRGEAGHGGGGHDHHGGHHVEHQQEVGPLLSDAPREQWELFVSFQSSEASMGQMPYIYIYIYMCMFIKVFLENYVYIYIYIYLEKKRLL